MDLEPVLLLSLARRLDAVTPPGVRVLSWAAENTVIIGCPDGPPLVSAYAAPFGGPEPFAQQLLDDVQEFTIENVVHGGWPPVDPARPRDRQTASALPHPGAALEDGVLHLWFGERDRPSLQLPPVTERELQELRERGAPGDDKLVESLWLGSLSGLRIAHCRISERIDSYGL